MTDRSFPPGPKRGRIGQTESVSGFHSSDPELVGGVKRVSATPVASEIAAKLIASEGVDPESAFAEPIGEHPLHYSEDLMESLRVAAMKAYWEATSRSAFWAGVLKGEWRDGRLEIRDWESWGEFEGAEAFAAQLEARREESREWIGWFRTKLGRDARMMDPDVALFERYFPKAHQTTLILRPSAQRPLLAAFFFRNEAGTVRPTRPVRELVLVERPVQMGSAEPSEPAPKRLERTEPVGAPVELFSQTLGLVESHGRRSWWRVAIGLALLGGMGAAAWEIPAPLIQAGREIRSLVVPVAAAQTPVASDSGPNAIPSSGLRVAGIEPGQWQVAWNRQWLEQYPFSTGSISVTQGKATSTFALTANQLMLGILSVPRTAEDITVTLAVEAPGRAVIEERVRVVGPLEAMVPAAQLRLEQEKNARLKQEMETLRRQTGVR